MDNKGYTAVDHHDMTKEEFLEGFKDALRDMDDPGGDFMMFLSEAQAIAEGVRPFDPELAHLFDEVGIAFKNVGDYVKLKAAELGVDSKGGS